MAFGEETKRDGERERGGEYRPVRMHRASADKHFSIAFCRVDVALETAYNTQLQLIDTAKRIQQQDIERWIDRANKKIR